MIAEDRNGLVERRQAVGGARLHQAAFHDSQYEAGQPRAVQIRRQTVTRIPQPALHVAGPIFEILVDQPPSLWIAIADLQREISDWATHPATVPQHAPAVLIEQREDPLDWIGSLTFHRFHHGGSEIVDCKFEHLEKELVLAFEKVVEAPRVDARFSNDGSDAGGMKALLVEKLERGSENTLSGFQFGRRPLLSVHSIHLERMLKACQPSEKYLLTTVCVERMI